MTGVARTITLVVEGKPVGKGRPRFVRATGRTYTDSLTLHAEERIRLEWIHAGRPRLPDQALDLYVEIALARPRDHFLADGGLSAAGRRTPWPLRKPDVDNALKLVADALNGCAYRDDSLIARGTVLRRWATATGGEHTLIHLAPMPARHQLNRPSLVFPHFEESA